MGNIKKNSPEWAMMSDLFKLYDEFLTVNPDDANEFAKKQFEFEKKYKNVRGARDLSEGLSANILRRGNGKITDFE